MEDFVSTESAPVFSDTRWCEALQTSVGDDCLLSPTDLMTLDDALPPSVLPCPMPRALARSQPQSPQPSHPPQRSSSTSDSDGAGSSSSSSRHPRTMARLCKSPEGPKFASGAFKNAPPPAALPPPPVTFIFGLATPQPKQPQETILSDCVSPPLADPAIIAIRAARPVDIRETMTAQLCQLLKIRA